MKTKARILDRKFGGYEFEDWGWRKYDRIPELFLNHVISLEPGNYSEVIESKSGFHILYVVERRSTLIQDKIVRYRAKHILKRVDDERMTEAFESLKEIKTRVLAGERFEYFAKDFRMMKNQRRMKGILDGHIKAIMFQALSEKQ